jgi:hypothetical protein
MIEKNKASSKISTDTTSARRGFLKKAAISAPILTTIAARPVWAGQCSLSGNLSNNVSNHEHPDNCELNIYSPGGWLCGSANNSNLWGYVPYTKYSPLKDLLGSLLPGVPDNITIGEALAGNPTQCGLQGTLSASGWERQLAGAALNAILWQKAKLECTDNPTCSILAAIDPTFYFPFTLQQIRDIYSNPAAYSATYNDNYWEGIQNIN